MAHPWDEKRPVSAWHPGGFSRENKDRISRNFRPVLDSEKCTKCSLCWIFCPDSCITRGETYFIDCTYCKGCGVCATECPRDAIEMVREEQV